MAPANSSKSPAQAPSFRVAAKTRLIELGVSVTELAHRLGLARNTVSIAINHETMMPSVKERIRKELNL